MKSLHSVIIILFAVQSAFCQQTDYRLYHQYINLAETHFFVSQNRDSAFYYFDKAFTAFDFIFAKDAINAVQLALYSKRPFQHYLIKGYENGLRPDYFKAIKLTQELYAKLVTDTTMTRLYKTARAKYLKKVNFQYLQAIYEISMEDQIKKNSSDLDYADFRKMCINVLRVYSKKYGGFPGSKLLGIADSMIFKEVGLPSFDWNKKKQKYGKSLDYFKIDNDLSSKFFIIIMVHNDCAFLELEKELKDAVIKGEIHPREVGLVYDNMFRPGANSRYYSCTKPPMQKGVFYLNSYTDYRTIPVPDTTVNSLRASWNIVPLKIDGLKQEFADQNGARLFWGFWDCL
jgi:hypothetical protein